MIPTYTVLRQVSMDLGEPIEAQQTYYQFNSPNESAIAHFAEALNAILSLIEQKLNKYNLRWLTYTLDSSRVSYPLPFLFIKPYSVFYNTFAAPLVNPVVAYPYWEFVNIHGSELIVRQPTGGKLHLVYYSSHPKFDGLFSQFIWTNNSANILRYRRGSNQVTVQNGVLMGIASSLFRSLRIETSLYWITNTAQSGNDAIFTLDSNVGQYPEQDTTDRTTTNYGIQDFIDLPTNFQDALVTGITYRLKLMSKDLDEAEYYYKLFQFHITELSRQFLSGNSPNFGGQIAITE